jgi:zinc protease
MDIMNIMKTYVQKGVTKNELEFTKSSYIGRDALKYETNAQKAYFAQRVLEYQLQDDFTQVQAKMLKELKVKDVNNLAKKYLPLDKMVIVVVGDAAKLKDKLSKIGDYEVVIVQPDSGK